MGRTKSGGIYTFMAACLMIGLSSFSLCAQTNGVTRELYTGITGANVSDLTNRDIFPGSPTIVDLLTNFEAPTNVGINYGQRLSAWITAPITGNYIFWIASDDGSSLYLSTDDQPANKQLIAIVPGQTAPREWTKYSQQQSVNIPLQAGQRYYLEALMKQANSDDNLAVRWQMPDTTIEEPIPSIRLQPFCSPAPDHVVMHRNNKVRIAVTANDTGYFSNLVQIVTSPAYGSATPGNNGTVLYAHTTGNPTTDSFTYQLIGAGGSLSSPATVTVAFTNAPRFDSSFAHFPAQTASSEWQLQDAFPGLTFNAPNCMCSAPGDAQKIFLVESAGRVWLIPDAGAAVPSKVLFLDIQDHVLTDHFERGAKGIACHPGFATNGFIFVTYDNRDQGTNYMRVSRFTRSLTNSFKADPATEVVLINQLDEGPYHDVDTCRFGRDGYLYVGIGDEGGSLEDYHNAQIIDKDLYSCILRIDVDKRPGNLEPNPNSNIPRDTNGNAYYSVPLDNPFVGATNFNNQPVNPAQVRTEMYVVGMRNPWQFSFDPTTNKLWVADVGNDCIEKVVVMGPGENAGWSFVEGLFIDDFSVLHTNLWGGPRRFETIHGAVFEDMTLTLPLFEYWHGNATNQGHSITGGFIYQGTNYPDLNGNYIFGDFISGHVWTFNPTNSYGSFHRLTGASSVANFLPDPSNNDILVLQWGPDGNNIGQILRLTHPVTTKPFPPTLTDSGFFADLADLSPNPGAEHYTPNLRFWSDYADKNRWFLIQNSTNTVTYSLNDPWTFPVGMVWAKHFDLDMERGNPATSKRIETRFLVKTATGAYGLTYRWNAAGTEAYLEPEAGEDFDLTVTNNGAPIIQHYHIPSRTECLTCHTPSVGSVLSFSTRQLNLDGTIAGVTSNQLALLAADGYLLGLDQNPTNLPRYYRANETNTPVEARVRSYLAVNCAYCHSSLGAAPPSWDGRPQLSRNQTGLLYGQPLAAGTDLADRLIIPGDVSHSVVWLRVGRTNGLTQMPPLASNEQDQEDLQLLTDWINNGLTGQTDYDVWRFNNFGNLTSPQGDPDADPDGDGKSNWAEFLEYTDPNNVTDHYQPVITASSNQVSILLPHFAARTVTVLTSTDLGLTDPWILWSVPGNGGIPFSGQTNSFTGSITDPQRFFKILIQQP